MNQLVKQNFQPPNTIEDLSRFVLVGREKLISVRAEIRAIDRLQLAEEVRTQKIEEAQMLSEALLDAEVRLGELFKQMPKSNGGRPEKTIDSGVYSFCDTKKWNGDSTVTNQKPKYTAVEELGFSLKQVERFETLANNKDLVQQVKQEARENEDIPTRTRVLDLAKERNKREKEGAQPILPKEPNPEYSAYLDKCHRTFNFYHDAICKVRQMNVEDSALKEFSELLDSSFIQEYIEKIDECIPKLLKIQRYLKELRT